MKRYGKKLNKVLFLDIDGVLNGYDIFQSKRPYPLSEFNEEKVNILNSLFEEIPDLKLVLSSSWRFFDGIENIVKASGISKELFSITPYSEKSRGDEIKQWIKDFNKPCIYCIVDDIDDFYDDQKDSIVFTNPNIGITEKDVEKIKLILNG